MWQKDNSMDWRLQTMSLHQMVVCTFAGHAAREASEKRGSCAKSENQTNINGEGSVQPAVQLASSSWRAERQEAAKYHPCRSEAVSPGRMEKDIALIKQPKLSAARPGHIPGKIGSAQSVDSCLNAAKPDRTLVLKPSTLPQGACQISGASSAKGIAAQRDEPGGENMPALFGIFGRAKLQEPGCSREAIPQIDDDEIQKEVQQKMMRHRRKRMRRMQN